MGTFERLLRKREAGAACQIEAIILKKQWVVQYCLKAVRLFDRHFKRQVFAWRNRDRPMQRTALKYDVLAAQAVGIAKLQAILNLVKLRGSKSACDILSVINLDTEQRKLFIRPRGKKHVIYTSFKLFLCSCKPVCLTCFRLLRVWLEPAVERKENGAVTQI